ncbi:hypothetical protein KI387_038089, partial [Taxus chinensis]
LGSLNVMTLGSLRLLLISYKFVFVKTLKICSVQLYAALYCGAFLGLDHSFETVKTIPEVFTILLQ